MQTKKTRKISEQEVMNDKGFKKFDYKKKENLLAKRRVQNLITLAISFMIHQMTLEMCP